MIKNQKQIEEKIAKQATVITIERLREIQGDFEKYRQGKINLDTRVIENEDWWKLQHWKNYRKKNDENKDRTDPTSAWMFNSIMNKHADAMDNYPEPAILPREEGDVESAKTLSSIVPVILDNCDFEETYSDAWWDKLKNGCSFYGVFWNPTLNRGLGDVDIRNIDMLSIYWEPGIEKLQDSRGLFIIALRDNKVLEAEYPQLKGKLQGGAINKKEYNFDDQVDTTDKSVVFDYYYKVSDGYGTKLHYVKYCGDEVLFSSEDAKNELGAPLYANGFYESGNYPIITDVLYKEKGTPTGFGYVDIMRNPQEYIDKLGQAIQENAQWSAKPRWFTKDSASINLEQYKNLDNMFVNVAGSVDENNLRPIEVKEISGNVLNVMEMKIDELKETSGNRDFSQGSTSNGVTAAAAIAALQEAGSKGSRDMIKGSYRTFANICKAVIELMRQFYDESRAFRILGENGNVQFVEFSNEALAGGTSSEFGIDFKNTDPMFDVKVKAQKANPYSRMAQNELALEFYGKGFFNPQLTDQALMCIDMMDFDGKEQIRDKIQQNGTMYAKLMQMTQIAIETAGALATATGDRRVLDALLQQEQTGQPIPQISLSGESGGSQADKARDKARESTEIK